MNIKNGFVQVVILDYFRLTFGCIEKVENKKNFRKKKKRWLYR